MIEFFFGLAVGVFMTAVNKRTYVDLHEADKILIWDSGTLGWRPISNSALVKDHERVLFAFEMKKNEK